MQCYRGSAGALKIQKCTLACPILNHFFAGGLPCGSITELTGEASASKTQICLQLLLSCQLPTHLGGLNGNAVYLYTEGEPALTRLNKIAESFKYRFDPQYASILDPKVLINNIFVENNFEDGKSLLDRLKRIRELLTRPGPRRVRLLIVDSIAWLFRDLLDDGGELTAATAGPQRDCLNNRTELLFKISSLLRKYADEFNLVVVVTNQIMDAMKSAAGVAAGHTGGLQLISSGREVIPALGLAWANCVNTRIFLSKETTGYRGATRILHYGPIGISLHRAIQNGAAVMPAAPPQLRFMQIVFSPSLPQGNRCAYVVDQTGVRGLHPDEVHGAAENDN